MKENFQSILSFRMRNTITEVEKFWTNFNMDLYISIIKAKQKKEYEASIR